MKPFPSWSSGLKKEAGKPRDEIDLTVDHGSRRVDRKKPSNQSERRTDPFHFVDLHGSYDYDAYYAPCFDEKLKLNIKGPFANLHWTFSSFESDSNRRVVTETRPFQSHPGKPVPQFLPNFKSPWHRQFGKIEERLNINMETFRKEIDAVIQSSEEMKMENEKGDESEWEILGLRAYKVPNKTTVSFNVLNRSPDQPLAVADFSDDAGALILYAYASSIENDPSRSVEDKLQVKQWLKTMPPRPPKAKKDSNTNDQEKDKKTSKGKAGFKPGAASLFFRDVYGDDNSCVLDRIMSKSMHPDLNRPDKAAYKDGYSALQPDQEVLDSLPNENFFTTIYNSHNVGKYLQSCITLFQSTFAFIYLYLWM